jgi:hypothetical protein
MGSICSQLRDCELAQAVAGAWPAVQLKWDPAGGGWVRMTAWPVGTDTVRTVAAVKVGPAGAIAMLPLAVPLLTTLTWTDDVVGAV